MKLTKYRLKSGNISGKLHIGLCSDLHDRDGSEGLELLERAGVDLICIPGDLTQRIDLAEGQGDVFHPHISHENALAFLAGCAKIAPTFYSLGNHEMGSGRGELAQVGRLIFDEIAESISKTGAKFVTHAQKYDRFSIASVSSALYAKDGRPDLSAAVELSKMEGFRILLCHHPEYYPLYLAELDVDLVLAGHAHGGQIRLFGRGLYAPGQGILPSLTAGVHGRMVISKGMSNTVPVPRLFNPTEVVLVEIEGTKV